MKLFLVVVPMLAGQLGCAGAALTETASASAPSRSGVTLHVSKLGDNSDGLSWRTAVRTIQAALSAVPNARGGHRIVVRPDTYMEANLFPANKGAADAYNELVGDGDGRLGSGTRGWVVIDSGDSERGFKSYDWWGPIRASLNLPDGPIFTTASGISAPGQSSSARSFRGRWRSSLRAVSQRLRRPIGQK